MSVVNGLYVESILRTVLDNRATLKRVSVYFRTVRYELTPRYGPTIYGPTFPATVQEWERAVD